MQAAREHGGPMHPRLSGSAGGVAPAEEKIRNVDPASKQKYKTWGSMNCRNWELNFNPKYADFRLVRNYAADRCPRGARPHAHLRAADLLELARRSLGVWWCWPAEGS